MRMESLKRGSLIMTWKTSRDCQKCGASYELEVWDLGHQETDSIQCECCGEIILKWRKEARSYSISRTISPGNLSLKYEDWGKYKGKKLKFTKGDVVIEGVLKGLGTSVMAVSVEKVVNPWEIETENEIVSLCPEDGWRICVRNVA